MQPDLSNLPRTIWWEIDKTNDLAGVYLVDQTRLPLAGDVLVCQTLEGVELAIKSMAVRGAPAIGIAAALALAVWTHNQSQEQDTSSFLAALKVQAAKIAAARPTAVNLSWAALQVVDFAQDFAEKNQNQNSKKDQAITQAGILDSLKLGLEEFAVSLIAADEVANRAIGANGSKLLEPGSKVMTICNAGSLATAYYGTALGVVYSAAADQKIDHVWVTETRPVGQGARLTTWELMSAGIPCTLITDSMAASCMAQGWVDAVLVGADRIAANGDTANKIGTLSLAILANHFKIPFYVCAPSTTIDANIKSGADITIELRDPRELSGFNASGIILPNSSVQQNALDAITAEGECVLEFKHGAQMQLTRKGGGYALDSWFAQVPPNTSIYNPAFDVTPAEFITAIITDVGVFHKPFTF